MNRNLIHYRFTRPSRRLDRARMDNIAIVPASLLFQSGKVQEVANRLPAGSVLLCSSTLPKQRKILDTVANFFKGHGHQVTTIHATGLTA